MLTSSLCSSESRKVKYVAQTITLHSHDATIDARSHRNRLRVIALRVERTRKSDAQSNVESNVESDAQKERKKEMLVLSLVLLVSAQVLTGHSLFTQVLGPDSKTRVPQRVAIFFKLAYASTA